MALTRAQKQAHKRAVLLAALDAEDATILAALTDERQPTTDVLLAERYPDPRQLIEESCHGNQGQPQLR